MFKQFRDGWKGPKIMKAVNAASAAVAVGRIDIAEARLAEAYKLLIDTTLLQTAHTEMIFTWRLLAMALRDRGRTDLAEQCTTMANLLQARFDAGDFYREY